MKLKGFKVYEKNLTLQPAEQPRLAAQVFSRRDYYNLGKDIRYQSPPVEEFQALLQQGGVPAMYSGMLTTWARAVAQGMLDVPDSTLASFLGRKPTTTAQFLTQVYA